MVLRFRTQAFFARLLPMKMAPSRWHFFVVCLIPYLVLAPAWGSDPIACGTLMGEYERDVRYLQTLERDIPQRINTIIGRANNFEREYRDCLLGEASARCKSRIYDSLKDSFSTLIRMSRDREQVQMDIQRLNRDLRMECHRFYRVGTVQMDHTGSARLTRELIRDRDSIASLARQIELNIECDRAQLRALGPMEAFSIYYEALNKESDATVEFLNQENLMIAGCESLGSTRQRCLLDFGEPARARIDEFEQLVNRADAALNELIRELGALPNSCQGIEAPEVRFADLLIYFGDVRTDVQSWRARFTN